MSHMHIQAAKDKGAGYARLQPGRALSPPVQIAIQRCDRDNQTFLGRPTHTSSGKEQTWQDYPTFFDIDLETGTSASECNLLLGPEICNHIDPDLDVVFVIRDAESPEIRTDFVFWPDVPKSGRLGESTIVVPPRPVEAPPPPRQSKKDAEDPEEKVQETDPDDETSEGKSGTETSEPPVTPPGPHVEKPGFVKRHWLALSVVFLVLIGSTGTVLYAFQQSLLCETGLSNCNETAGGDETAPAPPPSPPPVSNWERLIAGGPERWSEFYGDPSADPAEVHRLADHLMEDPDSPERFNHGVEALWAAAQQDHVPALLAVAALYDPVSDSGPTSAQVEKKPGLAMDHYMRAKRQGSADAAPAIERLCGWLSDQRFTGDGSANRLFSDNCGGRE